MKFGSREVTTVVAIAIGVYLKYISASVHEYICVLGFGFVGLCVLEVSDRLRLAHVQRERQIQLLQELLQKRI